MSAITATPKTSAAPVARSSIEPITLDIEASAPPPIEKRDVYWCGAFDDCPVAVALGGFEFPAWSGRVVRDDGSSARSKHIDRTDRGACHSMTEAQVKVVLEMAANKVIRGGRLIPKTGSKRRPFVPMRDDIPIGCFLYMAKVTGPIDRMGDSMLPPPMVPRPEGFKKV
jgi:hypothetical protein